MQRNHLIRSLPLAVLTQSAVKPAHSKDELLNSAAGVFLEDLLFDQLLDGDVWIF
jgi:hypothetical protein